MDLSAEQHTALEAFRNGDNVFLTGPGGSGKTALIKELCAMEADENYEADEVGQLGIEIFTTIKSTYKHLMPTTL